MNLPSNGLGNEDRYNNNNNRSFNDNTDSFNTEIHNHFSGPKKISSISLIFQFCKKISELDISLREEYSTEVNSGWDSKIEYNELDLYKTIFEERYLCIDDVEKALENVLKRDKMIENIKTKYKKIQVFNPFCSKDLLLDKLFQDLSDIVVESGRSADQDINEEEKDDAIYKILFYVFVKCQILDPVPT